MAHNRMIYEDYRKVALKKLKTCRRLEKSYSRISSNQEKNDILRSIYYLSGYILEGTINYSIYKVLAFQSNQDVKKLNKFFDSGKKISFFKHQQNIRNSYYIQNHDFMRNIDILKIRLPSRFATIPVLNNGSQNPRIYSLLLNWNVQVRYQTQSTNYQPFNFETYSENEIFAFLNFAEEIYKKLPQIV